MDIIRIEDQFDRELPLFKIRYRKIKAFIYFTTQSGQVRWRLIMMDNKGNHTEEVFTTFGYAVLNWWWHYWSMDFYY